MEVVENKESSYKELTTDTLAILLTLPSGESAHFKRVTDWDTVSEPRDGNLSAVWLYLPLTNTLDLSEESSINLCPRGQSISSSPPDCPAII
jgi:hypothetical protein